MSKVLIIQFRKDKEWLEQEKGCFVREIGDEVEMDFLNALKSEIDWNDLVSDLENYHGVVLCGTGDLDFHGNRSDCDEIRLASQHLLKSMSPLLTYLLENDMPTLGICYGHQLLGAFAGVEVVYDEWQKKRCSCELEFLVDKTKYELLADLPDKFHAYYGHKDVLVSVPKDATLLLSGGERCKVAGLKYKNNIFTFQFHPELNYFDIKQRVNIPGYLPEGVGLDEVFIKDDSTNMILRNFAKLVAKGR